MDVTGRLVTEAKRLALEEDDIKNEILQLKTELTLEEQNLQIITKDHENLCLQKENIQLALNGLSQHADTTNIFQEELKRSIMLHSFLKGFVDKSDPNEEQQKTCSDEMQSHYNTMLKKFENNSTYKSILREEAKDKEITELITEKRNQIMKLETQREF